MRSKSEFKAYVYEKASEKDKIFKKKRTVYIRTAFALSLCLAVSGIWLNTEGLGKNQVAEDAGAANEFAPMPLAIAEAEKAEEVFDAARGTEEFDDVLSYKCAATETSIVAHGSSSAILYSTMLDSAVTEAQFPYSIAENASEYDGERTDIDFETHIALVFNGMHILSHTVTFSEDTISVTLTTGDGEPKPYTVLLERARFTDQQICVTYP